MEKIHELLADKLNEAGWNLTKKLDSNLQWWADEIWLLASNTPPIGASAYITFLVDPQADFRTRKKNEYVSFIGNSKAYPNTKQEAEQNGTIKIDENIEKEITLLVGYLKSHRVR